MFHQSCKTEDDEEEEEAETGTFFPIHYGIEKKKKHEIQLARRRKNLVMVRSPGQRRSGITSSKGLVSSTAKEWQFRMRRSASSIGTDAQAAKSSSSLQSFAKSSIPLRESQISNPSNEI